MKRRTLLAGLGTLAGSALAGCTNSNNSPGQRTTTSTTAPDTPSPTTAEPTTTQQTTNRWRSEADSDLPIDVVNRDDSAHTVTLEVSQVDEVQHEESIEVESGDDREVYNLDALDPEGIQRYTITARIGEQSDSAVVKTSTCYGGVEIRIAKDGTINVVYALC